MVNQEILEFIQAMGRQEVKEYMEVELVFLEQALLALTPEDAANLVWVMSGRRDVVDATFYSRMKELGWSFEEDNNPLVDYGHNEDGFPCIGWVVEFPGGSFSANLNDIFHIIQRNKLVSELFVGGWWPI